MCEQKHLHHLPAWHVWVKQTVICGHVSDVIFLDGAGLISCNTYWNIHQDMWTLAFKWLIIKVLQNICQELFPAHPLVLPYGPFTLLMDTGAKYCSFLSVAAPYSSVPACVLLSTLSLIMRKLPNTCSIEIDWERSIENSYYYWVWGRDL